MPVNNVVAKVAVEVVAKNGTDILITAATKTTNFTRPDAVAMALGKAIKEPFLKADNIPEGTKEIIAREGLHTSDRDPRPHYTGLCVDEQGKTATIHFYPTSE